MTYAPIAILVNIPATLFATAYYEFLMRDSFLIIGKGHAVHEDGESGLMKHISKTGRIPQDDLFRITSSGTGKPQAVHGMDAPSTLKY